MTPDIRLIAVDMDGTLLDGNGEVPDTLWPLLMQLEAAGVTFVPASGRQLATLRHSFGDAGARMTFIAENGAYVVRGSEEVSSDALDPRFVHDLVLRLRALAADGLDIGVVLCGKASAYVERTDAAFLAQAEPYYLDLERVEDLLACDDQFLKVAIFDFVSSELSIAPALADVAATHQVVVSGQHWVDVMNPGVNKGVALRALQRAMGIDRSQTAAFGDYLNDLELIDAAEWSYAMANAHDDVVSRARLQAPSNIDHGVISTVQGLLFP